MILPVVRTRSRSLATEWVSSHMRGRTLEQRLTAGESSEGVPTELTSPCARSAGGRRSSRLEIKRPTNFPTRATRIPAKFNGPREGRPDPCSARITSWARPWQAGPLARIGATIVPVSPKQKRLTRSSACSICWKAPPWPAMAPSACRVAASYGCGPGSDSRERAAPGREPRGRGAGIRAGRDCRLLLAPRRRAARAGEARQTGLLDQAFVKS